MKRLEPAITKASISHEATKNGCGFMHPLSKTSIEFASYAAEIKIPVVDLGCAYGSASIQAAKLGAQQVLACDMEHEHLQILKARAAKDGILPKISFKLGRFPENISFIPNTIGAVLASLVLAYLTKEELDIGLKSIFQWLEPGGKLFIVSYSIYIEEFSNAKFKKEYERRVNSNAKWPGYFEDFNEFSSIANNNINTKSVPLRLHFFDINPLTASLKDIGFEIETSEYLDGKTNGAVQETLYDGREMIGIIAKKPKKV